MSLLAGRPSQAASSPGDRRCPAAPPRSTPSVAGPPVAAPTAASPVTDRVITASAPSALSDVACARTPAVVSAAAAATIGPTVTRRRLPPSVSAPPLAPRRLRPLAPDPGSRRGPGRPACLPADVGRGGRTPRRSADAACGPAHRRRIEPGCAGRAGDDDLVAPVTGLVPAVAAGVTAPVTDVVAPWRASFRRGGTGGVRSRRAGRGVIPNVAMPGSRRDHARRRHSLAYPGADRDGRRRRRRQPSSHGGADLSHRSLTSYSVWLHQSCRRGRAVWRRRSRSCRCRRAVAGMLAPVVTGVAAPVAGVLRRS